MKTVLDVVHDRRAALGPGNTVPVPLADIWAANTISEDELDAFHKAEAERLKAQDAQDTADAIEAREADMHQRMLAAGVPERYSWVNGDGSDLALLRQGKGVYIHGEVNTGKTHRACRMLRAWLDCGFGPSRFVMSADLVAAMRPGGDPGLVSACIGTGLLVIDDLGKEQPTDFALTELFRLIDARYGALRPTIVTTQYPPAKLAAAFAERGDSEMAKALVSRLTRDGAKVLRVTGRGEAA